SALPTDRRARAHLIFTAHSIPTAMAQASPYERQLHAGAGAVAKRLGFAEYLGAHQSPSRNPREPGHGPDIVDVVKEKAARGVHTLLVVPIGFVCDHVEVLYDLDVEARQTAAALGGERVRAPPLT